MMTNYLAFSLFAFISSITPGPNNLMLLTSGVNFGFKKSLPHMMGISVGFFILLASIGLGLGQLVIDVPWIFNLLKWGSVLYLIYLSWVIATARGVTNQNEPVVQKPISFLEAAIFQWINPKAWIMAISAYTLYVPVDVNQIAVIYAAALFSIICLPCILIWLYFGVSLKLVLSNPVNLRLFNYTMAGLLLLSLFSFIS